MAEQKNTQVFDGAVLAAADENVPITAELRAKKRKSSKRRIWEIDFLRGICILLMIFDHTMFDFSMLYDLSGNYYSLTHTFVFKISEFAYGYWEDGVRIAVRLGVVFLFLILSGISCSLTRSNTKRLAKMAAASLVLSIATAIIDVIIPGLEIMIVFGILHIMTLSLLIYILLKKLVKNKYIILAAGLLIIAGGLMIGYESIGFVYNLDFRTAIDMLIGKVAYGGDCYGILPYTGVFLVGAFIGEVVYEDKYSLLPCLDNPVFTPFCFVGRNSIFFYLLHQPVIFGSVMLIAKLSGFDVF